MRSLDATTAPVCLTGAGLPLGSKFPHVPTSPTCLGVPGDVGECCGDSPNPLRAVRGQAPGPADVGEIPPSFLFFLPHFWVRCSAMDLHSAGMSRGAAAPPALSLALATMPTPFLAASLCSSRSCSSLHRTCLRAVRLSGTGAPGARGPLNPDPHGPAQRYFLGGQSSSPSGAHLLGPILKEVTKGWCWGAWAGPELGQGLGTGGDRHRGVPIPVCAGAVQSGFSKTFRLRAGL